MKLRITAIMVLVLLAAASCYAATSSSSSGNDKPKPVEVPMAERPMIAVVAFDDGSLQRQSWWGSSWNIGSGLADILTTALLETNRFRLVERSLLESVMKEQDLGASGRVDPKTAAKIGSIIGADYLIMGKVTQFSWDTKSTGAVIPIGGWGGVGASKTKARVGVDLRVVDSTTSEILGSYNGYGEESKGKLVVGHQDIGGFAIGSSDFMNTILGMATRKAINAWVENFCKAVDSKKITLIAKNKPRIHPDGIVLNVEGNTIIANTGTVKGYAVGDKVEIHRKTKELKDPETGEIVKVMTDLIATGVVTKAEEKTCDITFTAVGDKQPAEGDIVKFVSSPSTSGS